ncbi:MAG: glycosyltransferase [Candidatus Eisenbacteria bacterium]|nr:glycosyltransferase [Candidatus Eisenbacteria bacterium]
MSTPSRTGTPARGQDERAPVSVFVPTLNESDRLGRCLASVWWADEVVVVDSGSTDGTAAVAERFGARFIHHPWEGYSAQKAFAVTQCRHNWLLWLDADEEVTETLARAIRGALAAPPPPAGFAVARRTVYLGKPLRFGGWYPDWKVRLFHRDAGRFDGRAVHETVAVDGPVRRLEGDLRHYSYRNLSHHLRKIDDYSRLWAEEHRGRVPTRTVDLLLRPPAKFLKSYVLRLGFLEGWRGLLVAALGAVYVGLKYAKLFELAHRPRISEEGERHDGRETG